MRLLTIIELSCTSAEDKHSSFLLKNMAWRKQSFIKIGLELKLFAKHEGGGKSLKGGGQAEKIIIWQRLINYILHFENGTLITNSFCSSFQLCGLS